MNYLTEFDLYIDILSIVYTFCAKIDSKKKRCTRKHNKQTNDDDDKASEQINC